MNYIDLIRNFWLIDEQRGFNGNETRLYFFLLNLANRLYWQAKWLEYGDDRMKANIGISAAVLRTTRNNLKEAMLIDFVVGGSKFRVKTRYQILTPILNPILNPNLEPTPYNNKTNTKQNIIAMNDFQKENLSHRAATSISRLDICIEALKERFADEKKKSDALRFPFPFDYEEYKTMLAQSANIILEHRREKNSFVIDNLNESIIRQLYLYLRLDEHFAGDLQKGIMLVGKYGSGKTLIMEALSEMYNVVVRSLHIPRPMLRFVKSSNLLSEIQEKSVLAFSKMPLIIDEFGREPKQVMDFGNIRCPMIELICERYDFGSWTHGTSNFTLETLCSENQYGKMTGDRIKSMFNFVKLSGESRRK